MSVFESYGGLMIVWFVPVSPMCGIVPIQFTPSSDGEPIFLHSLTRSGWSAPLRRPVTQSVTGAPVFRPPPSGLDDSRTRHGSGVPRGLSSVKSFGVPRSSNAPLRSKRIVEVIDEQASRSSG